MSVRRSAPADRGVPAIGVNRPMWGSGEKMSAVLERLLKVYLAAITLIGIAWIVDVPQYFGLSFIAAEWIGLLLGVGVAAAFLRYPYFDRATALEGALGIAAIASWLWMSVNYNAWVIDISGYTPSKYIPGIVAIVLLMEAMRKTAGLAITILVWTLIAYALFGWVLPPPLGADRLT